MVVEMLDAVIRIGIVSFLSLLFGLIRQRLHKPIGFGTFILVAVGASVLAIIAQHLNADDPLGLVGATVTGIGFIGAGALIRNADKTSGFTSASTIWLFAIFGVAIGLGEMVLGLIAYGISIIVIIIDMYLVSKGIGAYQKKLTITTNKLVSGQEMDKVLAGSRHKLLGVEVNKVEGKMVLTFVIEGTKERINQLSRDLLQQPWFVGCKVE